MVGTLRVGRGRDSQGPEILAWKGPDYARGIFLFKKGGGHRGTPIIEGGPREKADRDREECKVWQRKRKEKQVHG